VFDIGFWELVLISIVALVVLGPTRLPHAIRTVSKFISTAKVMAHSVKEELHQELKIHELQENLRKAEQMGMQDLPADLQSSVETLKQAAQDVQRPYAKAPDNHDNSMIEDPNSMMAEQPYNADIVESESPLEQELTYADSVKTETKISPAIPTEKLH
jgi:sec-independent protein translocase protein TatB